MYEILSLTIPFFGIILLGSLCRLRGWFSHGDGVVIARYVFFVVLPPFLFLAITSSPLEGIVNFPFILRYEGVTIFLFLCAYLLSRSCFGLASKAAALFSLNATYPNYGYIGVPLALLAFGAEAALPMSVILVTNHVVLLLLLSFFAHQGEGLSVPALLIRTLKSLGRNPLLWAVGTAIAFSAAGFSLPEMPDLFLELLGGAAVPTALFALGITLVGQPMKDAKGELGTIILFKLGLHPLLVTGVFLLLPYGVGAHEIDVIWIKTAIFFTCLPVAVNVFALSEFYGLYSGRSATAIMLTTLLASVSVPLCLYLMRFLVVT